MSYLTGAELLRLYGGLSAAQQAEVVALIQRLGQGNGRQGRRMHRVIGRLLFEHDGLDGTPKPLHHMLLELRDRDTGSIDDLLGVGETDAEGRFEIWYDPADAGWGDAPDLNLRVFEPSHVFRGSAAEDTKRLVYTISGPDNVAAQTYDFGVRRIPYWEYDPEAVTPRVLIVEHGDAPQAYSTGRTVELVKVMAPLEAVKRKHLLINRMNPDEPSLAEIQQDYPTPRTIVLERERPGYTRSDEYFGERFLNGMVASVLNRDPRNPNRYWIHYHWNSYPHNGEFAQPNVDIRFELQGERLMPVEITLQMRKPGVTEPNAPLEPAQTFTPADGERWLQAKRVARVSASLAAEMDNHLATTHLNTEQYALAVYQNIRKNPLRYLLYPHIKEVVLINHQADTSLIGPTGYVTRAAGLTAEGWKTRIRQTMGMLDWKGWRPRRPMTAGHVYAHAANLFWEALTDYVDGFFAQNGDGIVAHWREVHLFSRELVERSVPVFLCHYLQKHSSPAGDPAEALRVPAWLATDERMDFSVPRPRVNGIARAVQPVTETDTPTEDDLENMKQVCRYVLMHALFMHTWTNSQQFDDGGELVYAGLGLRYGKNGVLSPEWDTSIAPPPHLATEQLWFSVMLSKTGFGYVTKNEDGDISPLLVEALRKRKQQFKALGVSVDMFQSRTNI